MKTCSKCKESKPLDEFFNSKDSKDGKLASCKSCKKKYVNENKKAIKKKRKEYYLKNKDKIKKYNEDNKETQKEYRLKNKSILAKKSKEYQIKNKEVIKEKRKVFYDDNKETLLKKKRDSYKLNPEKFKKRNLENRKKEDKDKRREYMNRYVSNKCANDPVFKIKFNVRTLIRNNIKGKGYTKRSRTYDILGVDYNTFKTYIERQFKEGMTWENQGEWHLDHIAPMASAQTEDEVIKLNHYTNFQPLWELDNLQKSDKIISGTQITLTI